MVILGDCGSPDPGSSLGPGLLLYGPASQVVPAEKRFFVSGWLASGSICSSGCILTRDHPCLATRAGKGVTGNRHVPLHPVSAERADAERRSSPILYHFPPFGFFTSHTQSGLLSEILQINLLPQGIPVMTERGDMQPWRNSQ